MKPTPPSRPWQVADGLWALLFAFAAFVNLNDPDPVVWLGLYGAGAAGCVLDAVGLVRLRTAVSMAVLYTLGGVLMASQGLEGSQAMKGFPQYGIFKQEVVRESLGLGLVALWMAVVAVRLWRTEGAADPEAQA